MKRILFMLLACLVLSVAGTSTASASSFDSLYKTARSYIGVPYKYGGTTASGFDCSGFTQVVFQKNGVSIPRTTGQQYSTGQAVSKSNLQPGDLVFFNTSKSGVSHVGIYVGSNNFIHASTSRGVMISSINDPYYWGSRYVGAKRVKDFSAQTAEVARVDLPTRAEVAELLVKELGLTTTSTTSVFKDVSSNHPQLANINAVAAAGIFSGYNGNFRPNDHLTRAEMAKILVDSFNLTGNSNYRFKDVASNNWANPYIQTLYARGITVGYGNGNFGVNDKVTTKQLKAFIDRIKYLK